MLDKAQVAVIIPCFRARDYLNAVLDRLENAGYYHVLVVDDCCPDKTFEIAEDRGVMFIRLQNNLGVGGAFSAGLKLMLESCPFPNIRYVAKLDADDQHDPRCLEVMQRTIEYTESDFVKGDRYALGRIPCNQPLVRKIGNIGLSFLTKLSTGFWHINDPLNGQFIGDIRFFSIVQGLGGLEHRYLFETSILVAASRLKAKVQDCPNVIKYDGEVSSLSVSTEMKKFAVFHIKTVVARLWRDYFYPNFDLFSLTILFSLLFPIGIVFGFYHYIVGIIRDTPTEIGTLVIILLMTVIGYISLILFMLNDRDKYRPRLNISRFFYK